MTDQKLPWMKFNATEFMGDGQVGMMTATERGIYISLMCHCWTEGSVPHDQRRMALIANATVEEVEGAWSTLSECFLPHPEKEGHLIQPRIERERRRALEQRRKMSEGGRKRAKSAERGEGGQFTSQDPSHDTSGGSSPRGEDTSPPGDTRASGVLDSSGVESTTQGEEEREKEGEPDPDYVRAPPDEWPVASELAEDSGGYLIYPLEFEEVWSDRVPRDGSNPKKRGYRQYRKSRRDGMSREQAELALDYRRREAERKGDVGERHVEQFATFFGQDDLWRDYLERPDPADVHDMSQADRRLAKRRAELEADDLEQVPI